MNEKWDAIGLLLENGWPGEFDDAAQGAYRALLHGYDPEQVAVALRVLVRRGNRFRPSAAEIAAEIDADPGRPTWSEAYRLMFGQRGLLTIRPGAACLRRAEDKHPLLAAFVRQEGYERLRMLPVHDPDWGEKVRRDLEASWDALGARADHRRSRGLELDAVVRPRQLGPRRPDFQKALPGGPA